MYIEERFAVVIEHPMFQGEPCYIRGIESGCVSDACTYVQEWEHRVLILASKRIWHDALEYPERADWLVGRGMQRLGCRMFAPANTEVILPISKETVELTGEARKNAIVRELENFLQCPVRLLPK